MGEAPCPRIEYKVVWGEGGKQMQFHLHLQAWDWNQSHSSCSLPLSPCSHPFPSSLSPGFSWGLAVARAGGIQEFGLDDLMRALPTLIFYVFYDSKWQMGKGRCQGMQAVGWAAGGVQVGRQAAQGLSGSGGTSTTEAGIWCAGTRGQGARGRG